MLIDKFKNIEKNTIEDLSDKYVEENKEKQKIEAKLEKYIKWKKNNINDIKELISYIEYHRTDKNMCFTQPIIDELESIMDRAL